jgi:hypothetical protein
MRFMAEMPPIPAPEPVETEGGYEMTAELPGIDAGDIELKVTGDMLTLRGEKRESSERTDKGRHLSERRYGSFQRTLRLPPTPMRAASPRNRERRSDRDHPACRRGEVEGAADRDQRRLTLQESTANNATPAASPAPSAR